MHGAEGPEDLQAYGNELELHRGPRCSPWWQCSGHFFRIPPYSSSPRGRSSTRTPSRSTAHTASASAARVVASGSRGRGKEIATPEPSDEDDGDSSSSSHAAASERGDPTYVSEIPMDVLFDAPPATQTQEESTSQVRNLKISF
jgi:hypothetical protein